ncbi:bpi fold-containing family b member 4-like [Limosa lapponica baueri]|uniref:Bpi fold-containing family b member 4-like n=1 Tax=Limosa lapponica baueri TaxID=1758121 RepID=A0A2I0T0F2_LIMLA|nr:bpi fold-containing family b member 4-like [Limosa lapponica baueri]
MYLHWCCGSQGLNFPLSPHPQACNIINARLNVVSNLVGSRNPALPLGAVGDLPPFSIISGDAIQLDLNLSSGQHLLEGADECGPAMSVLMPPLGLYLIFTC